MQTYTVLSVEAVESDTATASLAKQVTFAAPWQGLSITHTHTHTHTHTPLVLVGGFRLFVDDVPPTVFSANLN